VKKKVISALIILALLAVPAFTAGCDTVTSFFKKNQTQNAKAAKRVTFLKAYDAMKKEVAKKADDALLVGVLLLKKPEEAWDGSSSTWRAAFYSQKNQKVYTVMWENGSVRIDKEDKPEKGIENKVIAGPVSVDSVDALEIAKATMLTQIDPNAQTNLTELILAYSNSKKKHVWKISFANNHYVYVDAVSGEVLEAK
jgi:hypothetical protein